MSGRTRLSWARRCTVAAMGAAALALGSVTGPIDAAMAAEPSPMPTYGAPPTVERLVNSSFESGTGSWSAGNQTITLYGQSGGAKEGARWAVASTAQRGSSLAQTVAVPTGPGDEYRCSMWVRARGGWFSAQLNLWALGGSGSEAGATPITVGPRWTQVSAVVHPTTSHSSLKCELYLNTVSRYLDVDGASLTGTGLQNASFDNGSQGWSWGKGDTLWGTGQGDISIQPVNRSDAREGNSMVVVTSRDGSALSNAPASSAASSAASRCSMWVKTDSAAFPADPVEPEDGLSVQLYAFRRNTSNQIIQSGTTISVVGSRWELITATVPGSTGASSLQCQLSPSSAVPIDVDAVSVANVGLVNPSFQVGYSPSTQGWFPGNGAVSFVATDAQGPIVEEVAYGSVSTPVSGRSVAQDAYAGSGSHRCTMWVRSRDGSTFSGQLTVWALDLGRGVSTPFWVGATWTQVSVQLDTSFPGRIRCELYLNDTNRGLDLDAASLR